MTTREFLANLESLFLAERYGEALEFGSALIVEMTPRLSREERDQMHGMMEVAARIVELDRAAMVKAGRRTA
jgi:hypothetical protein